MRRFLRHVVEQKAAGNVAELKESLIGVSVFDRDPGYDPKVDAIVRVEARRLRTKLAEYYEGSGSADPIRIVFPKGSYVPEFVTVEAPGQAPTVPAVELAGKHTTVYPWWLRGGLGAGLVLAGVVLGYVKSNAPESGRVRPFTSLPGYERSPSFSPDGQTVAFGWAGPGQTTMRIYVQKLGSDNPAPVTSGVENDVAAAWSPNGSTIAFFRQGENNRWDVMTVPSSGGPQRKLADVVARISTELRITWDPDSRYLLTSSRRDSSALPSLVMVSLESGQVTPVKGSQPGDFFPNLSPNGKVLGFLREYGADVADLMTAPWTANGVDSGHTHRIAPERSLISGFDWLSSGGGLVFSSERGGAAQLWRANLDGGEPKLIAAAAPEALTPSLSRRGARMAWVHRYRDINIWSVAPDGSNKHLVIGSTAEDMNPQFSPDGQRVVFRSNRSGSTEIWTAARDGSAQKKLTSFERTQVREPRWSPDGKLIVFVATVEGNADLYTIPSDGGMPRRWFTTQCNESEPSWSRDGKWIYYVSECNGRSQIRKRAFEGGNETVLAADGGNAPVEHTDGYVYYFRDGIWRVPREGGTPQLVYGGIGASLWGNWALADRGLYHLKYRALAGPSIIQFFDFETRQDRDVTALAQHPVLWTESLAVSGDGREILFAQLDQAGADILTLEGIQ